MSHKGIWLLIALMIFLKVTTAAVAQDIPPSTHPASEEGFEPVDLDKVSSVNGKAHVIAAFAIVMIILLLYSYSLLRRERAIKKDLEKLTERFPKHPPA